MHIMYPNSFGRTNRTSLSGATVVVFIAAAAATLSGCAFGPGRFTAMLVRGNGLLDQQGIQLLVVETQYDTTDPEAPYWNDLTGNRNYRTRIAHSAVGDLGDTTVVLEWDDSLGESFQGWPQTAPFAWYRPSEEEGVLGKLVLVANSLPVVRDLDTGIRTTLPPLPEEREREIFWQDDLVDDGSPPNAVEIAYVGANWYDLLFRHALALYDYDGTYLGVWTPLTLAAEGIDPEIATFQLMPPRIDPPLPGIEPPAPPVMSAVPSLSRAHFLWLRDSAGVIVAASFPVADDPQADWTPRAWTLTWSPPGESDGELRFSVSARTEVPDEPYQGPGRAFTADGRLLVSRYDSRGDVFALDYHELAEGWAPFGERETISVNDAWWVF
jgi:hypothetical protein